MFIDPSNVSPGCNTPSQSRISQRPSETSTPRQCIVLSPVSINDSTRIDISHGVEDIT